MPEPISTISPRTVRSAKPIHQRLDEKATCKMPPEELLAILMAQEVKELPASSPMRKKPAQSFAINRRQSTYPQHRKTLFEIIKANPGTTTRKIADQLEMGVKTILNIVQKMEAEGLVRREVKVKNQAWQIFAVEQEQ